MQVRRPPDEDAVVTVQALRTGRIIGRDSLRFDGVSGRLLDSPEPDFDMTRFRRLMLDLHEGHLAPAHCCAGPTSAAASWAAR